MIVAYEYRNFLESQKQAKHTVAILNMFSKRPVSMQDFTGVWYDNQIWDKDSLFNYLHNRGGE